VSADGCWLHWPVPPSLSALAGSTPAFTRGSESDQHFSPARTAAEPVPPKVHRVFLVDDHELVRRAIVDLLADEPDLQVVGEASTAADALARIPTLDVDVVVLEAHLRGRSGTDLSKDLMAQVPGVACLLLVPTLDDPAVLDAVVGGVYGVVPKTSTADVLTAAVRAAGEGDTTLPTTLLSSMLTQGEEHQRMTVSGSALDQLTARERQILALVAQGKTHQEIAAQMYISPNSLRNYLSHITAKLGLLQRDQTPRNTQPAEPE
jgi:two-component system response regulator DevR